jgi:hypothetical protein
MATALTSYEQQSHGQSVVSVPRIASVSPTPSPVVIRWKGPPQKDVMRLMIASGYTLTELSVSPTLWFGQVSEATFTKLAEPTPMNSGLNRLALE